MHAPCLCLRGKRNAPSYVAKKCNCIEWPVSKHDQAKVYSWHSSPEQGLSFPSASKPSRGTPLGEAAAVCMRGWVPALAGVTGRLSRGGSRWQQARMGAPGDALRWGQFESEQPALGRTCFSQPCAARAPLPCSAPVLTVLTTAQVNRSAAPRDAAAAGRVAAMCCQVAAAS